MRNITIDNVNSSRIKLETADLFIDNLVFAKDEFKIDEPSLDKLKTY